MNTQTYIVSPKTGKFILVDGPTYNTLLKSPYASQVKKAKRVERPTKSSHQKQFGKTTNVKDVKLQKSSVKQQSGRGGKTKGWKEAAPKRGAERNALKTKCGNECFLKPDSNGFPICASLRKGKNDCKVDCRGIIAAQVRAGIWDYKDVHEAAMMLSKKYGC
jgi:hypothetical protein